MATGREDPFLDFSTKLRIKLNSQQFDQLVDLAMELGCTKEALVHLVLSEFLKETKVADIRNDRISEVTKKGLSSRSLRERLQTMEKLNETNGL